MPVRKKNLFGGYETMKIEFLTKLNGFSLRDTLVFDNLYEPELQMELFYKEGLFQTSSLVCTFMMIDGVLAGEIYGIRARDVGEDGEEVIPDSRESMWKEMYCYSFTVLPEYRYQSIMMNVSMLMKQHWIQQVRTKGYRYIVGHATSSGAQRINAELGAVFYPDHNIENIFDSDRLGRYYELQLCK